MSSPKIAVEIVYALPTAGARRILLPDGSTVEDAILLSGLRAAFPEWTRRTSESMGTRSLTTILRDRTRRKSTGRCGRIPRSQAGVRREKRAKE